MTAFIVCQLVFDVAMVLLLAAIVRRARPAPPPEVAPAPPAPAAARPEPAPAGGDDRFRQAFALLRAGAAADEVARRSRLLPGEAQLIKNLVAAEAALEGRNNG